MSIAYPSHELMKIWPSYIQAQLRRSRITASRTEKCHRTTRAHHFSTARQTQLSTFLPRHGDIESLFINALIQAGSCIPSRQKWKTRDLKAPGTTRVSWVQPVLSYGRLPLLVREDVEAIGQPLTRQRLLGLVDWYGENDAKPEPSETDVMEKYQEQAMDFYTSSGGSNLYWQLTDEHWKHLKQLAQMIDTIYPVVKESSRKRKSSHHAVPMSELWKLYYSLPLERIAYLPDEYQSKFLFILKQLARRSEKVTLKFFSVLDDMRRARIPVSNQLYSNALYLAGHKGGRITAVEVESTLRRWIDMEQTAGIASTTTIFNILFDVAVKGEQYALAEMVIDEMKQRKIKQDRFTRVGLIYYYGLRGDGDAIRRTYRELVQQDHIVDGTVLNAVITSLLRSGESEAAEHVYQRMNTHFKIYGRPLDGAQTSPQWVGRFLRYKVPALSRAHNIRVLEQLQQEQDISPNVRTFIILIEHHVTNTGDLDRITQLLDEMQSVGIPPSGRVFLDLFRGFYMHGGIKYTLWTRYSLERVCHAFEQLVEEGSDTSQPSIYWDYWVTVWLLRAFAKCFDRATALAKWTFIKAKWRDSARHESVIMEIISDAAGRRGSSVHNHGRRSG